MSISTRFILYTCTCLGLGLCWHGDQASAVTPAARSVQWELRLLDGQPVAQYQRYLDNTLLPCLPTSTAQRAGTCLPSLSTQLAGTMHLIVNLLEADNTALNFGLHYLNLLQAIRTYEVSGNRLCLYDADCTTPRLVFVAAPSS